MVSVNTLYHQSRNDETQQREANLQRGGIRIQHVTYGKKKNDVVFAV
jgi:hypothetical protein